MSLRMRHLLKSHPNPSFLLCTYLEIEKDQCDNLRTTSLNLPRLLARVLQTQSKPLLLRGSRTVSAMCSHSSPLSPPQTVHTFSLLGASSLMQCTAEVSACLKPTFVLSYHRDFSQTILLLFTPSLFSLWLKTGVLQGLQRRQTSLPCL